jgi:hypothetical protein
MKPPQLFALIVRVVGLLSLLYMLGSTVLLAGIGLSWLFAVKAILWLLLSLWLLRGAPGLVRFSYPDAD